MTHIFAFTYREVLLTAFIVVPASILWIITERLPIALLVAAFAYGVYFTVSDPARREQGTAKIKMLVAQILERVRTRTIQRV